MDDDDDYDDLPPTSRLPPTSPLPPKLRARPARPALPPKQKINKSSEVVRQLFIYWLSY
jgi:hypothetical protein